MIDDSGEENLLQPQLGGPPCHLEGAEVQLASLLEGDPQTSPRDPGESQRQAGLGHTEGWLGRAEGWGAHEVRLLADCLLRLHYYYYKDCRV